MQNQHNLIVKYLQIISEQEEMINKLSKSNSTLLNRNNELKSQKNLYRESAQEWKHKYEVVRDCLLDIASTLKENKAVDPYTKQAIDTYKQNQEGGKQ